MHSWSPGDPLAALWWAWHAMVSFRLHRRGMTVCCRPERSAFCAKWVEPSRARSTAGSTPLPTALTALPPWHTWARCDPLGSGSLGWLPTAGPPAAPRRPGAARRLENWLNRMHWGQHDASMLGSRSAAWTRRRPPAVRKLTFRFAAARRWAALLLGLLGHWQKQRGQALTTPLALRRGLGADAPSGCLDLAHDPACGGDTTRRRGDGIRPLAKPAAAWGRRRSVLVVDCHERNRNYRIASCHTPTLPAPQIDGAFSDVWVGQIACVPTGSARTSGWSSTS